MRTITRWWLAPAMKVWLTTQQSAARYIPRPSDDPHAHAPGPEADRILIFGAGPAMGWGVVSHDIALPGSVARLLTAHTGRGTDVDVIAQMKLTVSNAMSTLTELDLTGYDAILLTLGTREAVGMASPKRWRRELADVVLTLISRASPDAMIFLVGVVPIQSVPGFRSRMGAIAARNATEFNEATAALCAAEPQTFFVPLSSVAALMSPAQRDGRTYRTWAGEIAEIMIPAMDRAHPHRANH
jgi:lysophospholipase L1-like esterase